MNPYSDFSVPAFDRFLVWLSTTDLRLFFYGLEQFDGVVRFAHVLAAGILIGAILIVDVRLMGLGARLGVIDLAAHALPWAASGAVAALLSGVVLLLFDPIAVGVHTFFLPKMLFVVLGVTNVVGFHGLLGLRRVEQRPRAARALAAASLVLWTGVFLFASLNGAERISGSTVSLQH